MANLRIPGPTPLSPEVLLALSQQMISHRGKSYEKLHQEIVANLQYFFQTKNPIYLLTASGTAGLETGIVNFFSLVMRWFFYLRRVWQSLGGNWKKI